MKCTRQKTTTTTEHTKFQSVAAVAASSTIIQPLNKVSTYAFKVDRLAAALLVMSSVDPGKPRKGVASLLLRGRAIESLLLLVLWLLSPPEVLLLRALKNRRMLVV